MKLLTYCTKGLAISLPGLADSVFPGFCNSGETVKGKNSNFNNMKVIFTDVPLQKLTLTTSLGLYSKSSKKVVEGLKNGGVYILPVLN